MDGEDGPAQYDSVLAVDHDAVDVERLAVDVATHVRKEIFHCRGRSAFARPWDGLGVARDLPAEVVGEKVDDATDVAGADARVEFVDGRTSLLCHGNLLFLVGVLLCWLTSLLSSVLAHLETRSLRSSPIPSISLTRVAPAFRYRFGSRPMPTPAGVPVKMTSPGSRGRIEDRYETR